MVQAPERSYTSHNATQQWPFDIKLDLPLRLNSHLFYFKVYSHGLKCRLPVTNVQAPGQSKDRPDDITMRFLKLPPEP